nr:IS30 family transposase [Escherichia coli]
MNGTPIHERSRNIDNRRSLGHWEGDLVSGTKNSHIATLVDRKSRYTIILRLRGKDSVSVNQAFTDKFLSLPSELRKSLTWDRGMELARHLEFTVSTGVKVYYRQIPEFTVRTQKITDMGQRNGTGQTSRIYCQHRR